MSKHKDYRFSKGILNRNNHHTWPQTTLYGHRDKYSTVLMQNVDQWNIIDGPGIDPHKYGKVVLHKGIKTCAREKIRLKPPTFHKSQFKVDQRP